MKSFIKGENMKKLILITIILSNQIFAVENFLGVKYNAFTQKNEIYTINQETGASTMVKDFAFPSGFWQPGASFLDSYNGNLFLKDANGTYMKFNPKNNELTTLATVDSDFQTVFQTPWTGKDLIYKNAAEETQVGDANNGITISNSSSDTEIKDSDGKTIIKTTSSGETHIGENSLVTVERNGVQELYATDASGNNIDINITNGSDLLINGKSLSAGIASTIAMSHIDIADEGFSLGIGAGSFSEKERLAIGVGYGGVFNDKYSFKFKATASDNVYGAGLTIKY